MVARAADSVWALVSGLSSGKRERRALMVFQAFIDDSGSEPQSPVFILGGFVADHAQWAAFSGEWQAALDEAPRLDYFKMSEAANLGAHGQFARRLGWDEKKRDDRVAAFARIIAKHTRLRVSASIRHQDWAQIASLPAVERRLAIDTPYVMLAHRLILAVAVIGDRLGVSEPCDYIFDQQEGFSDELLKNWPDFKQNLEQSARSDLAKFVGSPPIFSDEKSFLPLQAADLYAWQIRRYYVNNHGVENQTIFIPPSLTLRMIEHIPAIDREYSTAELVRLREHLVELGEIFSRENPTVHLHAAAADRKQAKRDRSRARRAKPRLVSDPSSRKGAE
jgi:hypothetical protein